MFGTKTVRSRRNILIRWLMLLAALLLLFACDVKDGKEAGEQQIAVVKQEEQPDADSWPETAQSEDGQPLSTLFAEWDGRLVCGNRVLKPGAAFAVSIEDETVACRISLPYDRVANLTLHDLDTLSEQYITGYWSSEYHERHEIRLYQLGLRRGAFELELHFSSWEIGAYELEITDPATGDKRVYRFLRELPFRYEISRPTDTDTAILEKGVRDYLLAGETHAYNVTFSHPVDRASVEVFDFGMEGLEVEYDWHSDQSVTVRLTFDEQAVMEDYDRLDLQFYRARAADGIYRELAESGVLHVQPTRRKSFAFLDPATGTRDPYLKTLISYTRLDRSPSGKYVFAVETTVRESMFVDNYVLLDKAGKRIKTLNMDSPVWLKDEDVLLYRKDRSIMRYDVETGLEEAVWTASAPIEWVYFDYHAPSGRLVVVALRQNAQWELEADLYLYERVTDLHPRVFRGVFHDLEDYELYPEGVAFIDDDRLFIAYRADRDQERRVMDWATGELAALEPADNALPLTRGNLLRHSGGKWEIVSLADGVARPLAVAEPDRYADPYVWYKAVPLSEDWVALVRGGGVQDLLHVPTATVKTVKEQLLAPYPWSGEAAYLIPQQ